MLEAVEQEEKVLEADTLCCERRKCLKVVLQAWTFDEYLVLRLGDNKEAIPCSRKSTIL